MKQLNKREFNQISGGDSIPPCSRDVNRDEVPEYFIVYPEGCLQDAPYTPLTLG